MIANIRESGGIHPLASYGTLLLVAGGIGITHPMSYLHEVVTNFASRKIATRKVHLVWMIRNLGINSIQNSSVYLVKC
jgi:NAD(P)H-flavin reductase